MVIKSYCNYFVAGFESGFECVLKGVYLVRVAANNIVFAPSVIRFYPLVDVNATRTTEINHFFNAGAVDFWRVVPFTFYFRIPCGSKMYIDFYGHILFYFFDASSAH